MFDEKNSKWLNWYKTMIIILSAAIIIGGAVCWSILAADYEGGMGFLIFLLSALLSFVNLVCGMLVVNVVANIQKIRECLEKLAMGKNRNGVEVSPEVVQLPEL